MTASNLIYPFSTQDGSAIPLDIVEPLSFFFVSLVINTAKSFTIPAGFDIAYVISETDCILQFGATDIPNAPVAETVYDNAIFIPADLPCMIKLTPGEASAVTISASGKVRFNKIRQWAALTQPVQSQIG